MGPTKMRHGKRRENAVLEQWCRRRGSTHRYDWWVWLDHQFHKCTAFGYRYFLTFKVINWAWGGG